MSGARTPRDGRRHGTEVVVVTGASGGVGRATARAFGARGGPAARGRGGWWPAPPRAGGGAGAAGGGGR
ncbi:hypothetical protein ACFWIR_11885, partial [Streptomyces olivaceus]